MEPADIVRILLAASAAIYVLVGAGFAWGLVRLRSRVPVSPAESASDPTPPFVSVVIAARNEEIVLGACLERLTNQTWPSDRYEVLVVDDNSDDRTSDIIDAFSKKCCNIRPLHTGSAYPHFSAKKRPMALGVNSARGDIILTTDADCRVPSTWVAAMAAPFFNGADVVVGYSQLKARGSHLTWFERLQGLDFLSLMAAAAGSSHLGVPFAASGQNLAYRKSLYEKVGGFTSIGHRASGDDILLLQLMRRSGGTIVFADDPAAFVSTWRSETPVGFLQQRRRWASNACLQFRLNPGFFLYLSAVFLLSVLIPLGLIDPQLRDVAALAWAARATMDLAVLTAGALRFDRHDLLVMFPLWELLQIPYLLLVGVFGTVAGFTWKGTRYPVGQSALAGPAS